MANEADATRAAPPSARAPLRVGNCLVRPDANTIERDGHELRVTPKAMAVLYHLVAAAPRTVGRDELLDEVWAGACPTDEVVTQAIAELRRAFGEAAREGGCIETVPRVGYRLRCEVEAVPIAPTIVPRSVEPRVAAIPPQAESQRPSPPPPGRAVAWRGATGLLLAAVLAAVLALLPTIDPGPASAVPARDAPLVRPTTAMPGREQFAALSPDGTLVAFAAGGEDGEGTRILVKGLAVADRALVVSDPPAGAVDTHPVWSPDGGRIAYLRQQGGDCTLRIVGALGGAARSVGRCYGRTVDYFDWTADGSGLLVARMASDLGGAGAATRIARLDLETGALQPIDYAPRDAHELDLEPQASPDGRWIAFRRGVAPYSALWVMPAAGGAARVLDARAARLRGIAWYPDSAALLVSADYDGTQALHRIALDGSATVALGVADAHFPAVARGRPLAVAAVERQLHQVRELRAVDGAMVPGRAIPRASRSDDMPAYAPDGRRFAFVSRRSGVPELWVHDFATGAAHPATALGGMEPEWPQWSPDGGRIAFIVRGMDAALMVLDLDSGRVRRLAAPGPVRFGGWSRDGSALFASVRDAEGWAVWRIGADGAAPRRLGGSGALDPRQPFDEPALYYLKDGARGLYRLGLDDGRETRLGVEMGLYARGMYALRADGLWYLDAVSPELPLALLHVADWKRPADGEAMILPRMVAPVPRYAPLGQASFAPDGTSLLLVDAVHDDTDLVVIDLPP